MNERPEIWLLARGERLVAEVELQAADDPWRHGHVVRREGFAELAGPFEPEERLAAKLPRTPLRWLLAYRRLRAEIRLIGPDGHEVPDFLLYIEGTRASWRKLDATITELTLEGGLP